MKSISPFFNDLVSDGSKTDRWIQARKWGVAKRALTVDCFVFPFSGFFLGGKKSIPKEIVSRSSSACSTSLARRKFLRETFVCWSHRRERREFEARSRNWIWLHELTAQQLGYIAFPEVTPPSLTSMPQFHSSVNTLRPDSSKVNKPTCEVLDNGTIFHWQRSTYYPNSEIYSKA